MWFTVLITHALVLSISVSQLDGVLINKFVLVLHYVCNSYINMATHILLSCIATLPEVCSCTIKLVMYVANEHTSQFHS